MTDSPRGNGRSLRESDPLLADRIVGTPEQQAAARPAVAAGWDEPADIEKAPATIPDLSEVEVPPALKAEIEAHMAKYPNVRSAALPSLEAAQRVHGWCSPEALRQVAAVMRVTPAYLSMLATFYDMLNTEPVGRHYVYVCTSVSCHLRNAQALAEAMKAAKQEGDDVNVREFECLGACDMAPMANVDGRFIGPIDPSEAPEVLAALREGRTPLPGRGLGDEGFRLPWEGES
ncbi:MAG TPA: NAD(P)H-dependent oxidoreductase subunit E [Thermoleophilaceae bacterium]